MIDIAETKPKTNGQDYYSIDRMSNSAMTYFKRSPKHYLHYLSAKDEFETTPMLFGRAFHAAILEPDKYDSLFAIAPQVDGRTTEGKKVMAEFKAASGGKGILTVDETMKIKEMKDAIMNYQPARELLDQITETEKELLWTDEITQIKMKGKLDGYFTHAIVDLKTTQDAQPDNFSRSAFNFDLHRQAAVYMDGCKTLGIPAREFYFIAVEKEAPYGISVLKITKEFIQKGREQYEQILQDFLYWRNLGSPNVGYEFRNPFNVFDMNLPNWIK